MRGEPWLEAALLFLASVPLGRLLWKAPIRHEARRHRAAIVLLVGVAAMVLTALAWSATRAPIVWRLAAAIAVGTAVLAWVRARPAYGARRRLPPGSLGLAASLDAITNEDFYARAARRWGPVFKMSQFHRPVVCVTDLELGLDFVRTQAAALEQLPLPWNPLIPGGYVEFMNGSRHAHYRDILRRALNGAVISACREPVAAIMRGELAALARSGPTTDPDAFLARMTQAGLLRVFFGVAPAGPETRLFEEQLAAIDRRMHFVWRIPPQLEADVERMAGAVQRLARRQPDGVSVLSELARTSPEALDDPTVVRNLVFMVRDARFTLAGVLRWVLKLSCAHPRWTPELRREHDAGGDALATCFVNELFRLWQSEYVYRRTLRDCRLGAFRIPKGWIVRVCLREAHGRADVFPNPATFDPGRFVERRYGKHEYAPFSDGPHACFGAALTVTVAKTFLHELAAGFDAHLVGDGPVERGNRHWDHWRPSTRLRVALGAR